MGFVTTLQEKLGWEPLGGTLVPTGSGMMEASGTIRTGDLANQTHKAIWQLACTLKPMAYQLILMVGGWMEIVTKTQNCGIVCARRPSEPLFSVTNMGLTTFGNGLVIL